MPALDLLENVIVLRTIASNVDYNYMGVEDLEKIALEAEYLDVILPDYDLDELYNDNIDDLIEIHKDYMKTINEAYEELRLEILQKQEGDDNMIEELAKDAVDRLIIFDNETYISEVYEKTELAIESVRIAVRDAVEDILTEKGITVHY